MNKIEVIQKKAVCIIANAPYNSHAHEIFQEYNILKFNDIYNLYLVKYMYLQLNNMLPQPLLNKFNTCSDIHVNYTDNIDAPYWRQIVLSPQVLTTGTYYHKKLEIVSF